MRILNRAAHNISHEFNETHISSEADSDDGKHQEHSVQLSIVRIHLCMVGKAGGRFCSVLYIHWIFCGVSLRKGLKKSGTDFALSLYYLA